MKRDLTKPLTKWTKKALYAFTSALTELIAARAFEEVSASDISARAGFPRATFYNYFDDKYDLLDYYWLTVFGTPIIGLGKADEGPKIYFDRFYSLLERNEDTLRSVLEHNPMDGYLIASCRIYLTGEIKKMLAYLPTANGRPEAVTDELLAEHIASTLLLVLEKRFGSCRALSREEVLTSIQYLLGNFA